MPDNNDKLNQFHFCLSKTLGKTFVVNCLMMFDKEHMIYYTQYASSLSSLPPLAGGAAVPRPLAAGAPLPAAPPLAAAPRPAGAAFAVPFLDSSAFFLASAALIFSCHHC